MGLKGLNRFEGEEANKPDIVVMDKKEGKCLDIDIARPFDTRISQENLEQYQKELRNVDRENASK